MSNYVEKLAPLRARYRELASLMSEGGLSGEAYVKLSTEYAGLTPVVESIEEYETALHDMKNLEELLADPEMRDMAEEEYYSLKEKLPALEQSVRLALIPQDEADKKNAILEIRAGTGGDEAALFVGDLFTMYRGYAAEMGWSLEVMDTSEGEVGGYKQIVANISGHDVFAKLKFESGAHRVQRVPKTEAQGRIHTSAVTVAVLPEAEEVDVEILDKDLKIDTYRSQGAGGQHVNTTDSAIRITHIPSGVVVEVQDERSQHKNRAKAMTMLRSRLYEETWRRQQEEIAHARKLQVGTGDRSERIRTYNYPQGRVTDHRINLTLYKLDEVLAGAALHEIIDELIAQDNADKLAALEG